MEIVGLNYRRLPLKLPPIKNAGIMPEAEMFEAATKLSPFAREYACKWQLGPVGSTDMLLTEYLALFAFLFTKEPQLKQMRALFLGAGRGQAIDAARQTVPSLEWMATGLEPSSSPCPFDEHLQSVALTTGQLCIFRPQCAEQFSEAHHNAVLSAVTQYCGLVVIDMETNNEFGLRIALERVQPGGTVVWHVDNHVFYNNQALITDKLLSRFPRVYIATARVHDTYTSHFIICCDAQVQAAAQITRRLSSDLVNDLLDRWIAQRHSDYYDYLCLATYFDALGLSNSADVDAHWAAHATVYNTTALLNAKKDVFFA